MNQRHQLLMGAAIALMASCSSPAPEAPTAAIHASAAHAGHGAANRLNNGDLTPEQKQAIAEVRNVTTRFHDIAFATRPATQGGGGYTLQFPAGCAASPDGAQGFHYLSRDR